MISEATVRVWSCTQSTRKWNCVPSVRGTSVLYARPVFWKLVSLLPGTNTRALAVGKTWFHCHGKACVLVGNVREDTSRSDIPCYLTWECIRKLVQSTIQSTKDTSRASAAQRLSSGGAEGHRGTLSYTNQICIAIGYGAIPVDPHDIRDKHIGTFPASHPLQRGPNFATATRKAVPVPGPEC